MKILGKYPSLRLRRIRKSSWIRRLVSENNLSVNDLILPIFIREGKNKVETIKSMPGINRYTVDRIDQVVSKACKLKIPLIALFPYTPNNKKNDYLLISSKNISNSKNELIINNFPLSIKKILQLINTSFLKKNFQIQSEIKIGSYFLDFNSKEISNGSKKLFLTEREANLILFLSKSKLPVNVNKLQEKVWSYNSELETHTVETHIYRLRKKIKQKFKDENFIISTPNGYKIN